MDIITDIESSVLVLIKIATMLFLLFYIVFAGVVVKQARVMTETIQVGFEGQIKALVLVHFIFALVIFLSAIIVL
jgi:hypothetical protein